MFLILANWNETEPFKLQIKKGGCNKDTLFCYSENMCLKKGADKGHDLWRECQPVSEQRLRESKSS